MMILPTGSFGKMKPVIRASGNHHVCSVSARGIVSHLSVGLPRTDCIAVVCSWSACALNCRNPGSMGYTRCDQIPKCVGSSWDDPIQGELENEQGSIEIRDVPRIEMVAGLVTCWRRSSFWSLSFLLLDQFRFMFQKDLAFRIQCRQDICNQTTKAYNLHTSFKLCRSVMQVQLAKVSQ